MGAAHSKARHAKQQQDNVEGDGKVDSASSTPEERLLDAAERLRIAAVLDEWRAVLTEAFSAAMKHYGIDDGPLSVDAMVALVMTFNQGIMLERLSDVSRGHAELLASIDRWLASLEKQAPSRHRS